MEIQSMKVRSRNPNACEQCKIKKARCNPSEVEGKCQKCLKSGARCVPSERHPRPRRVERVSRTSGRVAELEKKLDGLLGSLTNRSTLIRVDNVDSPYQTDLSADAVEEDRASPNNSAGDIIEIHKHIFPDAGSDDESGDELDLPRPSSHEVNDPISSLGSSTSSHKPQTTSQSPNSHECEKLLACFQEMLPYFPFIVIPPEASQKLSQEKPFLHLAMLTTASFTHYARFQTILDTQFRQALSTRVIIGGQKSLEIVQGLLIYLAWYPYHINPRKAQTFQFLQILISLCNDLGMDQPSKHPGQSSHEYRRAYLGCYYLSTSFSTRFTKPNNISYTEYTKFCCDTFTEAPENPTDTLLPWLVNLAHSEASFTLSPLTTAIPHSAFQTYLDNHLFKPASTSLDLHPKTKEFATLTLNFIPLFQSGIMMPTGSRKPASSRLGTKPREKVSQETVIENLKPCLQNSISYLDTMLSLPPKSYRSFTFIQWSQIVWSILVLMTISFPLPTLSNLPKDIWDSEVARKEGRLGVYLESLCWRMSQLGGAKSASKGQIPGRRSGEAQNQYLIMETVLNFVKSSFDRRAKIATNSPSLSDQKHQETVPATTSPSSKIEPPPRKEQRQQQQPQPHTAAEPDFFSTSLTKCPMLNGGFRALATNGDSSSTASSAWSSPPMTYIGSRNPYHLGSGEGEYDFVSQPGGEWGVDSWDEFSMWESMPEMDWTVGGGDGFTGV